jgi:hypothetical protein
MNRAVPRAGREAPTGVRGRAGPARVVQADLEIAKWAAVLTMAVDHYGKIVDPDVFLTTHAFYAFYPGHLLALHLYDLYR